MSVEVARRVASGLAAVLALACLGGCSATSTWALCKDHLQPLNVPGAAAGAPR